MSHLPLWLNESFVLECLQAYLPLVNIRIHALNVLPAQMKGEQFLSSIIRFVVFYCTNGSTDVQEKRLLCKLALFDSKVRDQVAALNLYDKEMDMYEHILSNSKTLLQQIGNDERIFAEIINIRRDHEVIVLEDLGAYGFGLNKRQNGFDQVHARQILSKLAKFHATNAVLDETKPSLTRSFRNGVRIFSNEPNGLSNMFLGQMDVLIEVVSGWPNHDYYTTKLKRLRTCLIQKCIDTVRVEPGHFNTLIHADLWTNNIMLAYDGDANCLTGVALIDFQFSCWASPTLDLHYFFNTSLQEDLRLHQQEDLVQFYHNELVSTLNKLEYKKHIPSLHDFQVQFLEKAFYGFTSALLVQPFMLNEIPCEADIHDLYGNQEEEGARQFRQMVMSNPKVHQVIRQLLPIFDRRGLLD